MAAEEISFKHWVSLMVKLEKVDLWLIVYFIWKAQLAESIMVQIFASTIRKNFFKLTLYSTCMPFEVDILNNYEFFTKIAMKTAAADSIIGTHLLDEYSRICGLISHLRRTM